MSGSVVITLPKLSPIFKDYVECKNESVSKGRKRRLDHLSWEEKLQRKKLKNRVAAQTSRDRKKQKMDDMENTIRELMEHNQKLLDECENLKNLNEKLLAEKQSMQLQCRCAENRISEPSVGLVESNSRPAEGGPNGSGSRVHTSTAAPVQNRSSGASPPALSDEHELLESFADIDNITDLEEFAHSLLEDIAKEFDDHKTEIPSNNMSKDQPRKMVGSPQPNMETLISPLDSLTPKNQPLKNLQPSKNTQTSIPDENNFPQSDIILLDVSPTNLVEIEVVDSSLAGYISNFTPGADGECTTEVEIKLEQNKELDCSKSDCGYESLGSPENEEEIMSELWNQSFSELFPNLV